MKDFTPVAWAAFEEAASDRYDFKQCKRKDGSIYGVPSGSDCNKGTEVKTSAKKTDRVRTKAEVEKYGTGLALNMTQLAKEKGITLTPEFTKAVSESLKKEMAADGVHPSDIPKILAVMNRKMKGGGGAKGPGKAVHNDRKRVSKILQSGRITKETVQKAEKVLTDKGASPEYAQKFVKLQMLDLVSHQFLHSAGLGAMVQAIDSFGKPTPGNKPLPSEKDLQRQLNDAIKYRKTDKGDPIRSLNEKNVYEKLVNKIDIPKAKRDGERRMKDPAHRAKVYKALGIKPIVTQRSNAPRGLSNQEIGQLNRETRAGNQEAIRMMKASGMYDNQALDNINRYDANAHAKAAKHFGY